MLTPNEVHDKEFDTHRRGRLQVGQRAQQTDGSRVALPGAAVMGQSGLAVQGPTFPRGDRPVDGVGKVLA